MDAFTAYQMFMAIRLHFTGNYDYFKYRGELKLKKENFITRNDKYFYHKLSKRDDIEFFIASNMVHKPNIWIGDLFSSESEERYNNALKRKQSLSYVFKDNMSMYKTLDGALIPYNGDYPRALKDYQQGHITMETIIILNECLNVFDYWNKKLNDRVIFPEIRNRLEKYRGFLTIDIKKFNQILLDIFH